MSKNPVVHFEMPYEDAKRINKFYTQAFGWSMQQFGPEMGDYIIAQTAETDENNMVKTPGTINGGLFPKKQDGPLVPSVVISVANIKKAMLDVTNAGGTVLGEPVEIPGIGQYVSFKDTENNRVSLLQPTKVQ
ncbi:MAG: VOC family protein [Patescibacteria group bacterium]